MIFKVLQNQEKPVKISLSTKSFYGNGLSLKISLKMGLCGKLYLSAFCHSHRVVIHACLIETKTTKRKYFFSLKSWQVLNFYKNWFLWKNADYLWKERNSIQIFKNLLTILFIYVIIHYIILNTVMRNSKFLKILRELLAGVKQYLEKTELAFEWYAEIFSRQWRRSTVILTGYRLFGPYLIECVRFFEWIWVVPRRIILPFVSCFEMEGFFHF